VVPAIADDAMSGGGLAGEVSGLSRAGDGREGRVDRGQGAGLAKGKEPGSGRTQKRLREADDVDHRRASHDGTALSVGTRKQRAPGASAGRVVPVREWRR